MIFSIDNLLTAENLAFISDRIDNKDFIDGKKTAGWHAKTVKENTQLFSVKNDFIFQLQNRSSMRS